MRARAALTSALGKGDSLSNEDFNNPGLQSASSAVSRTNAGTIATAHAATASSPINRSCYGRGADDASDDLPARADALATSLTKHLTTLHVVCSNRYQLVCGASALNQCVDVLKKPLFAVAAGRVISPSGASI
jgi:hypothetical protein